MDTFCWRRSTLRHTPAILHWCQTEQPRPTVTSSRCCIWWKRGCIAIAATSNSTRWAMHVDSQQATSKSTAMTHFSSFGRPVSQKGEMKWHVHRNNNSMIVIKYIAKHWYIIPTKEWTTMTSMTVSRCPGKRYPWSALHVYYQNFTKVLNYGLEIKKYYSTFQWKLQQWNFFFY